LLDDLESLISRFSIQIDGNDAISKEEGSFASMLLRKSDSRNQGSDQDHEQDQEIRELTENAIKPSVEETSVRSKDIVLKLLCIVENWVEQRSDFWAGVDSPANDQQSSTVQQLSEECKNTAQEFKKGQTEINHLQAKYHQFTEHVLRLKNELEMTKNRIRETEEELDEWKERLRRVESNIEREKKMSEAGALSSQTGAMSTISLLGDLNGTSREELLYFRHQALSRLTELEEMRAQRSQLQEELDKTRAQFMHLSDEKIQDSQYVKSVLVQIQSARYDADHYRSEVQRLRTELDDMHASRRRFVDTLEAEEKNRRATLEADVKKLENDIIRVRDSRDRFQQMYESRCNKDEYEMQQNQEIRKIANTRKDRITALSSEILRLQTMLTSASDDPMSFAFYLKDPQDKEALQDLRAKISEAENQLATLGMELESSREAMQQSRDLESVNASEAQLKEHVEGLTAKLANLDRLVGSEADDEVKALVATVEAKDEVIKRLELKIKAHKAVQAPLLSELHTVANAWDQLEKATSRKAIDLAQKDDLIFKLLSDKTRQESKCSNLVRAKEQSANMTAVMKRQSTMQQDQIRRLEEREKSLNQQMVSLEKEQTVLTSEAITHKIKLQEYTQLNSAFKEKFTKQEERLTGLQALLKGRMDAYENESTARKHLLEEAESMKRKIEENAKKSEGAGDSETVKQAARYLKLLKCPACDVNFKSHVILRCMHVFCKSCMDKQMEYRQRKCPTCRENFGAKDVKEIYL
ncbi:E3 ubiquitin-protein ligase bre1, partial [Lobosporangium transversale]